MRKLFKVVGSLFVLTLLVSVFIWNSALIQAQNDPETVFAISNQTPALNEVVTFSIIASKAQFRNVGYKWDFGDGVTAYGKQVTHAFTKVDDFKVGLTITDHYKYTNTTSRWIFVGRPNGWTEKTHLSEIGAYDVVFPADQVLRMDITISAGNFQTMETDVANINMGSSVDPVYVPVTLKFNNHTWWNVGMRYKGNSTLSMVRQMGKHKYPFMLNFDKFEADYPEIKNQNFYGFKKLSCNNNWSDASFIRDIVCSDLFRAGGVPTAHGSFCRMYIDTGDGPVYWGLYSIFEQPEDQMIKTQFPDANGNMYKPEGTGANWATWNQDAFEKKTNEDEADWSDAQAAVTALNADRSDAAAWRAGLEAVFNVRSFLRWLAINTAIVNWDSYGKMAQNYYLYQDLVHKGRLVWIPWDFNMSLSAAFVGGGMPNGFPSGMPFPSDMVFPSGELFPSGMPFPSGEIPGGMGGEALSLDLSEVDANWPLIRFLIDDPVYYNLYLDEMRKALFGCFDEAVVLAKIRRMHELVRPYVVGTDGENSDYTYLSNGATEFDQALTDLLTHISNRQIVVKQFLGLISASPTPTATPTVTP